MEDHMDTPPPPASPTIQLEDLKQRLSRAQEVVVDQAGKLHIPSDPSVASKPPQAKTVLKPQRWF
jgi:hypothetical protein